MFGEGVLELDSHREVRGGNCDTWRPDEIPGDLYSDLYYCQVKLFFISIHDE